LLVKLFTLPAVFGLMNKDVQSHHCQWVSLGEAEIGAKGDQFRTIGQGGPLASPWSHHCKRCCACSCHWLAKVN